MSSFEIREAVPDDLDAVVELRTQAMWTPDDAQYWFGETAADGGALVVEADGRVIGCARYEGVGQFFGGRRTPMGAVASVIVEPAWRGRGVGRALMRELIEAQRGRGLALSMLYASTLEFYRRVGYEVAGEGTNTLVPVAAFAALDRGSPDHLRTGTADDAAAIRSWYERVAPGRNGWFDRSDFWWSRYKLLDVPGVHVLVYEVDGRIEGYSMRRQSRQSDHGTTFTLLELVADDPVVTQTLWAALGAHSMQTDSIVVGNVPVDELLVVLREQWNEVKPLISDRTMSRILDLPAAVAARGFAASVDVRVELAVSDDVVSDNDGSFVLEISGGSGSVTPGASGASADGAGAVQLDIGALTAIYTGWTSATTLARHGRVTGPDGADPSRDALEALDAAFAGPTPFSVDDF